MSLRNIGIVAHINAGKTTLSERILHLTGKQSWFGEVESGTATMDWMVEEQRRGISITAAVTTVDWGGCRVNLIDTPGHVDFTAEVERCMRVLDAAIVLVDGVRGVESQTETVWRHAQARELPCLMFVNKLDRATADFDASVSSVERLLQCVPVVLTRPLYANGQFVGIVDVITGKRRFCGDEPAALDPFEIDLWRELVLEVCADTDPAVFADFVDGRPVSPARLAEALRSATLRREIVPVFAGSALLDVGVDRLLDGVAAFLPEPEPLDEAGGQFAALLYKVQVESDGCLGFLRLVSGSLEPGQEIEIASTGAPFRVSSLSRMHAIDREEVARVEAGDFVAVELPMPLKTGETLRAPGSTIVLGEMEFSEPVLTMSLEPRTSDGRDELETRARAMSFEDPTLRVRRDPEAESLLVSGMGELHLEVFGSRLNRRLSQPARFGKPRVARFETVRARAEASAELVRRFGSTEVAVAASVLVEPRARDAGIELVTVCEGSIADAAMAELRARLETGLASPWPARDLRVELTTLSAAGDDELGLDLIREVVATAARRAVAAGGRVLLEPVVEFVVTAPSESFSSVAADLRSRGAEISEVTPSFGVTRVRGSVPLAALLGYAGDLRSMTRGKGELRFELNRFEPVDRGGVE